MVNSISVCYKTNPVIKMTDSCSIPNAKEEPTPKELYKKIIKLLSTIFKHTKKYNISYTLLQNTLTWIFKISGTYYAAGIPEPLLCRSLSFLYPVF